MKDNIIQINPSTCTTPNRVQQIKDSLDLDLFPRMLANHPEHIARAKAKRDRIIAARRQAQRDEENFTLFLGGLSVSAMLGLMFLVGLIL